MTAVAATAAPSWPTADAAWGGSATTVLCSAVVSPVCTAVGHGASRRLSASLAWAPGQLALSGNAAEPYSHRRGEAASPPPSPLATTCPRQATAAVYRARGSVAGGVGGRHCAAETPSATLRATPPPPPAPASRREPCRSSRRQAWTLPGSAAPSHGAWASLSTMAATTARTAAGAEDAGRAVGSLRGARLVREAEKAPGPRAAVQAEARATRTAWRWSGAVLRSARPTAVPSGR